MKMAYDNLQPGWYKITIPANFMSYTDIVRLGNPIRVEGEKTVYELLQILKINSSDKVSFPVFKDDIIERMTENDIKQFKLENL